MKIEIPILRWGEVYRSLDTVTLETGGGPVIVTHTANPGLIRRDLLRVDEARAALEEIPAEKLADDCEAAKNHPDGYTAPTYDFNDDCAVDFIDFAMFAMSWLEDAALAEDGRYDPDAIFLPPFVQMKQRVRVP